MRADSRTPKAIANRARSFGATLLAALLLAGSPARGEAPGPRVVLRWQAIPGAAAYDLQVSRDPSFARSELELRVELAGHRMGPSSGDGRRYWRVRSVDAEGRPGPWSEAKVIEPLPLATEPGPAPTPEPAPVPLDVPPLPPEPLPDRGGQSMLPMSGTVALTSISPRAGEELRPPTLVPDWGLAEAPVVALLGGLEPGAMLGWHANLHGIEAPEVTAELAIPLPWRAGSWSAALRAGWWRERATVPESAGLTQPVEATADVVPISALLLRSLPTTWARLYLGAGAGLQLVVIRSGEQGSLSASGALLAVAGAGWRLGPGEGFAELSAGTGGVDTSLGRMRTGGISLAVGYRLPRGAGAPR